MPRTPARCRSRAAPALLAALALAALAATGARAPDPPGAGEERPLAALERLGVCAQRLALAESAYPAAEEFGGFVRLDTHSSALDAGCHYQGGEVAVIGIGLLLGITPGILLLFLLC